MKKILLVAAIASTFMAFAEGEAANATEVQQIGITKVNSTFANTIVAISYSGNIDKFVKTTNLTTDDLLFIYDNGSYSSWKLNESKNWVQVTDVSEKGINDGEDPSGFSRAIGTGIWLVRQNPTVPFYIYGTPASVATITVEAGANLIGNPYPTGKTPTITGATFRDAIYVPAGAGMAVYTYGRKKEEGEYVYGWYKNGVLDKIPTIPANTGFWYVAQESDKTTILWETNETDSTPAE